MKVKIGNFPKSGKRKISVKIDDHDVFSLDSTLSHIIHPALLKLKADKCGAPYVDDCDVPENLRSTSAPEKENYWDTDANHFLRWDWVLDEMIWAFGEIKDDVWEDQYHSGDIDMVLTPLGEMRSFTTGPNHTAKFDKVCYLKHLERINHGTTLFGKYYGALWT